MILNLNDFRYITDIADSGSFTLTAKKHFITQSALSQRIKSIESGYNVQLFRRDSTGVSLTDEGQLFVRHGKAILQDVDRLREEVQFKQSNRKTIKLGLSRALQSPVFNETLFQFYFRHTNLQLNISEHSSVVLQDLLKEETLDVAIGYLPVMNNHISSTLIYSDRYVILPAKNGQLYSRIQENRFLPKTPIPSQILVGEPFAAPGGDSRLLKYLNAISDEIHTPFNICHTTSSFPLLHELASQGVSSSILLQSFFYKNPNIKYGNFYYVSSNIDNEFCLAVMWKKGSPFHYVANEIAEISKDIMSTLE